MNFKKIGYPLVVAIMLMSAVTTSVIAAQPSAPGSATETPTTALPGNVPQDTSSPGTLDQAPMPGSSVIVEPGSDGTLQNQQVIVNTQQIEAEISEVEQVIDTVANDWSSVASNTDTFTVDALLSGAQALLDDARTSLGNGNYQQAQGLVRAADQATNAASALVQAQLADYGVPSQQAQASRKLVDAYYAVQEVSGQATRLTSVDVSFYVETAQELYAEAYDLYNAGTYEQAMQTANTAQQVSRIANTIWEANGLISSGPGGPGLGGPGPAGSIAPPMGGPGMAVEDATNLQPLTVPVPEF